ncbi:MAG: GNAT family N-acetyltransferase [Eubacterium sp.]|nr:GNAT family N-acetyltransferase [Eubacterium sp.]
MDELYKIYNKPEIASSIEPLYERPKEEEYLRAYKKNMYGFFGYGMWVIEEKATKKIIGRIGFDNREVNGEMTPELGYVIDPDWQRQGIAYECGKAALFYMSEELGISHINCVMPEDNIASINIAKKLGFEYVNSIEKFKLYEIFIQLN